MDELIFKKADQAGETLENYFGTYALVSKQFSYYGVRFSTIDNLSRFNPVFNTLETCVYFGFHSSSNNFFIDHFFYFA